MARMNACWLAAGIVWLGAIGGAAAQPDAERTTSLRREGFAPCTVAVRGGTAITLRCSGEPEKQCTIVGLADVVPGASIEQIATCEGAVVVLAADGAPLGGGWVDSSGGDVRVSILDAIVDDSDELLVRTTFFTADEGVDDEGDDEYLCLLKWRGAELVRIYNRLVRTSGQVVRVEIALSGFPRITETIARGRRVRRPTVLAWNAASFRFERARGPRAGWTEPLASRPLPPVSGPHQSRVSVSRAGDNDCTLAVEGSQATLHCNDLLGDCRVTAIADIAPEPGVERILACGDDNDDGVILVLVTADLRPLWTYHGGNAVTARAFDVVTGDGRPELLVEDRANCPMGHCEASQPPSWRVLRWRAGALEPVLTIEPRAADEIAVELRSDRGDMSTLLARSVSDGSATTARYVWNEGAGRFEEQGSTGQRGASRSDSGQARTGRPAQ